MKKIHKILLVFVLLVVAVAVIVISNLPIAKTQEAVGELLRKKLDLPQDAVITCAGDYTADAVYTALVYHAGSVHDALSGCGLPCTE